MDKFLHSVNLKEKNCTGCYNCIKRCPTNAIRVRNGKAEIIKEYCIDCGECVRACKQHAKISSRDKLNTTLASKYDYLVAVPSQALYSQFSHLDDVDILLTGLKMMGFNDIMEEASAAEVITEKTKEYIENNRDLWPIISTSCPTVLRLIRVRFPNLIEHLIPIMIPAEAAARTARKKAMAETGLPAERIGIIYIAPCPSKVSYKYAPIGTEKSEIDEVLAIKDIYRIILPYLNAARDQVLPLHKAGGAGIGWGRSGGESKALGLKDYIAADGIMSIIQVLEDLEDEKFDIVPFIELNACDGGCTGGTLNIENPFVARAKLMKIGKTMIADNRPEDMVEIEEEDLWWDDPVEYEPVYQLGSNFVESAKLLKKKEEIRSHFPGLDCGCCGAPSCEALARDVVRGNATEHYCIHILKDRLHEVAKNAKEFTETTTIGEVSPEEYASMTKDYINRMAYDIEELDNTIGFKGGNCEPEIDEDDN